MDDEAVRARLAALCQERQVSYALLSELIDRNPAYVQQFIRRGSPRRLEERDRARIAEYLGVPESDLGGPGAAPARNAPRFGRANPDGLSRVPRLSVRAAAGAGAFDGMERKTGDFAFDPAWLDRLGVRATDASIIRVQGDSMEPLLFHGDDILVDGAAASRPLADGVYVLRRDDALMVKRLSRRADGRIEVISDNENYPAYAVAADEIVVIGRVVWVSRAV